MCFGVGVVLFVGVGEVGAETVFEVDGGPVVECERWVAEDRFPVAYAVLWGISFFCN